MNNCLKSGQNKLLFSSLGHCFQATGADIDTNPAAALKNCRPLDIRQELTFRLSLREAHVMATHRPLATHFTFRHNFTLFDGHLVGVQMKGDQKVTLFI
jgi:hypothetical protein